MKARTLPSWLFLLILAGCAKDNLVHNLRVVYGSSSGDYLAGKEITLEANPAPGEFQVFDRWIGDVQFLNKADTSPATLVMPMEDVVLVATYVELPTYKLTLVSGLGSGTYFIGQQIRIAALPPPTIEQIFSRWTGDTLLIPETRAPFFTMNMPGEDLFLEAVYVDLPKYELEVVGGTGTGEYLEGARVELMAEPPPDFEFVEWQGSVEYLDDPLQPTTFLTMPDTAITVEGVFRERRISFNRDISPLVTTRCVDGGCHDLFHPKLVLTTYTDVANNLEAILEEIGPTGEMQYFTEEELALFLQWVEEGALKN